MKIKQKYERAVQLTLIALIATAPVTGVKADKSGVSPETQARELVARLQQIGPMPNCNTNDVSEITFDNDLTKFRRDLLNHRLSANIDEYIDRLNVDLATVDKAVVALKAEIKPNFQLPEARRKQLTHALNQLYTDMEPMGTFGERLDESEPAFLLAEHPIGGMLVGAVVGKVLGWATIKSRMSQALFGLVTTVAGFGIGMVTGHIHYLHNVSTLASESTTRKAFIKSFEAELKSIAALEKAVYTDQNLPRPSDAQSFESVRKHILDKL